MKRLREGHFAREILALVEVNLNVESRYGGEDPAEAAAEKKRPTSADALTRALAQSEMQRHREDYYDDYLKKHQDVDAEEEETLMDIAMQISRGAYKEDGSESEEEEEEEEGDAEGGGRDKVGHSKSLESLPSDKI